MLLVQYIEEVCEIVPAHLFVDGLRDERAERFGPARFHPLLREVQDLGVDAEATLVVDILLSYCDHLPRQERLRSDRAAFSPQSVARRGDPYRPFFVLARRLTLLSTWSRPLSIRGRLLSIRSRLQSIRGRLLSIRSRLLSIRGRLLSIRSRLRSMRGRPSTRGRLCRPFARRPPRLSRRATASCPSGSPRPPGPELPPPPGTDGVVTTPRRAPPAPSARWFAPTLRHAT
jgi:hypothetical protein